MVIKNSVEQSWWKSALEIASGALDSPFISKWLFGKKLDIKSQEVLV